MFGYLVGKTREADERERLPKRAQMAPLSEISFPSAGLQSSLLVSLPLYITLSDGWGRRVIKGTPPQGGKGHVDGSIPRWKGVLGPGTSRRVIVVGSLNISIAFVRPISRRLAAAGLWIVVLRDGGG